MMNWHNLQYFLAVARRGTLARAAEDLGVDASTIHRRLAALEKDLEGKLFQRSPRGYQITPLGEAILPAAEAMEESFLSLQRTVSGHDREARGTVRITLPRTILPLLSPLFAAFRKTCPHIVLDVNAVEHLLDLSQETDVAFRITEKPPSHSIARRIGTVAWGRYHHINSTDGSEWVALRGLDRVACVRDTQPEEGSEQIAFTVTSVADAVRLVEGGELQGCLPAYCGEANPNLRRIGALHPDRSIGLWLLIHVDLRKSARVRAFVTDTTTRLATTSFPGLLS